MKQILSWLLVLCLPVMVSAGTQKVIVRINKQAQKDTLGYNLLDNIPRLVYEAILNNSVKLWDSPQKRLQITGQTLQDIEKSNKFRFTDLDNIFVYETWTIRKKNIEVLTEGILFATRNQKDQEVTFGFVEYSELREKFHSALLPANANGFLNVDIDQVIRLKRYNYSIIQYGKRLISNEVLSEKLKNDIFHKKKLVYDGEIIQQNKRIVYTIRREEGINKKDKTGNLLLDILQEYFNQNIEEYMNLGASRFENLLKPIEVRVERTDVAEVWSKTQNVVSYRPEQLVISSNGHYLDPVSIESLLGWKLKVEWQAVDEFLKDKQFNYRIIKINDQEIPEKDSEKYLEALTNTGWSQLSEYVKR
jgi:hypothetical protein